MLRAIEQRGTMEAARTTELGGGTMTRTEIKREAKEMVAWKGPHNVLEFGEEIAGEMMLPKEHREEIVQEAVNQANRVLDFLGV